MCCVDFKINTLLIPLPFNYAIQADETQLCENQNVSSHDCILKFSHIWNQKTHANATETHLWNISHDKLFSPHGGGHGTDAGKGRVFPFEADGWPPLSLGIIEANLKTISAYNKKCLQINNY